MVRIPSWFAVAVIGAALLPGMRAEAQTAGTNADWIGQQTVKAVALCAAGSTDVQAIMRDARAAGWDGFNREMADGGLELHTAFNTRRPLTNASPFVALQVGQKTATYPGGVRLRQVACNAIPPISHAALLERQLAARFAGFSASSDLWVGLKKPGQVVTPLRGGAAQLQQSVSHLAVGESLITVEFNQQGKAAVGTVRVYQRSP